MFKANTKSMLSQIKTDNTKSMLSQIKTDKLKSYLAFANSERYFWREKTNRQGFH